jgi:hypothetical protein
MTSLDARYRLQPQTPFSPVPKHRASIVIHLLETVFRSVFSNFSSNHFFSYLVGVFYRSAVGPPVVCADHFGDCHWSLGDLPETASAPPVEAAAERADGNDRPAGNNRSASLFCKICKILSNAEG